MKWSWKIGRIAGIDLQIHVTFLILLLWVGFLHYQYHRSLIAAGEGVLFILAVFATVVLHELSHALTAKGFGIRTKNILLLPIGGIARLEKIPEKPLEGLLVSLAGPAVNLLLAAVIFGILVLTHSERTITPSLFIQGPFLARLMWVNVGLAVFNLLPAFPMDGGRVLRSLLAFWMTPLRATQIAAGLGQAMALLFFVFGLLFNPFLMLIAFFIWMGAAAEASMAEVKADIAGIPVDRAMITAFETVAPNDPLGRVAEHILAGFQHDFPVVEDNRLLGILTQRVLFKALAERGKEAPVREVMQTDFETAAPDEKLEDAFSRLESGDCRSMPVVRDDKIVGILTPENIGEFLMIRSALRRQPH